MATQPQFPTINVVPSGFRWSSEAANTAADRGVFLHVGGKSVGRRTLSGAVKGWASGDDKKGNTIFLIKHRMAGSPVNLRIAGTPENVRAALQYAGFSDADIEAAIRDAVTRDNYNTTKAQVYDDEIAHHAAVRKDKPVAEGYTWDQILWFAQNIKSAQVATKTGETRGPAAGGHAPRESLATKVAKVPAGKVIDVSDMDIVTGKTIRTIPIPKSGKTGKYGIDLANVPIISDNIDKYIRALQLAYGNDAEVRFADKIAQMRQVLSGAAAIAAPRPPSPRGAALAPAPQFAQRVTTPRGVFTLGGAGLVPVPPVRR